MVRMCPHRPRLAYELERRVRLDVIEKKTLGLSWGAFCGNQRMYRTRTAGGEGTGVGFREGDSLRNRSVSMPSSGSSCL